MFRRNLLCKYQLKSKLSRAVYSEITDRYPTMPFCARTLDSPQSRLAIKVPPRHAFAHTAHVPQECVEHKLLLPYAVKSERRGETVAQFKFTALVRADGTERITSHPLPYVHSAYRCVLVTGDVTISLACSIRDPELLALLA